MLSNILVTVTVWYDCNIFLPTVFDKKKTTWELWYENTTCGDNILKK